MQVYYHAHNGTILHVTPPLLPRTKQPQPPIGPPGPFYPPPPPPAPPPPAGMKWECHDGELGLGESLPRCLISLWCAMGVCHSVLAAPSCEALQIQFFLLQAYLPLSQYTHEIGFWYLVPPLTASHHSMCSFGKLVHLVQL